MAPRLRSISMALALEALQREPLALVGLALDIWQ